MNWKGFFWFTRAKLIVFTVLGILMNIFPRKYGICGDGINWGFCIYYHGFPFPSLISGEIGNIPSNFWPGIITGGTIGFLGNLLIVYLIVSITFFVYHKVKKR